MLKNLINIILGNNKGSDISDRLGIIKDVTFICNLRSPAVADAFQNGRCAEQNGRPKSLKITSC